MPLVIPAEHTAEAMSLLEEARLISKTLSEMPIERIDIDNFMAMEGRHHAIGLRIEEIARRE